MNTTIEEQIEINNRVCIIATQSKESAIKFLEDAGITKKQVINGAAETECAKDIYKVKNTKYPIMNTTIEEQIKILEEATNMALKSKESAVKYLQDAGIIKKEGPPIMPESHKYVPVN